MIPLAPIVAAAILASRAFGNSNGDGGQERPGGWAWVVWLLAVPTLIVLALGTLAGAIHPLVGGPGSALLLVLLFPWWTARRILAPLGLPRTAYVVGALSDLTWQQDHRGGGAIAGAIALHRRGWDEAAAAWLGRRLGAGRRLQAGGIVAHSLLLAARGDRDGARELLESALSIPPALAPASAHRLAAEWLAADAAARGDWARVAELGDGLGPRSRTTRLLALVAHRLDGTATINDRHLILAWLRSDHRLGSWRLLRRALATGAAAPPVPEPATVEPAGELPPLERALHLHAQLLARPRRAIRGEHLRLLGESWDRVRRDGATLRLADERAAALGLGSGSKAVAELLAVATSDLTTLARQAGVALGDLDCPGPTVEAAERALRGHLLDELELAAASLGARAAERRALPAIDEWRQWLALRRQAEAAAKVGGLRLRREAFPTLHRDLGKLAVWLWNERRERTLAHPIFLWLLAEAITVGDSRAEELQRKNVACGA